MFLRVQTNKPLRLVHAAEKCRYKYSVLRFRLFDLDRWAEIACARGALGYDYDSDVLSQQGWFNLRTPRIREILQLKPATSKNLINLECEKTIAYGLRKLNDVVEDKDAARHSPVSAWLHTEIRNLLETPTFAIYR